MPFVQTALYQTDDQSLLHMAAYRIRALGSGNLKSTLYSLDSVKSQALSSLVLSNPNNKLQSNLANFISQRVMIRFYTDAIDETFNISKLILFIKPIYNQKPQ